MNLPPPNSSPQVLKKRVVLFSAPLDALTQKYCKSDTPLTGAKPISFAAKEASY